MYANVESLQLFNGYSVPIFGLGTWMIKGPGAVDIIKKSIDIGYRHIDTAALYENEVEVGKAIADKIADETVTRDDLFVTSKAWGTHRTRSRIAEQCKSLLKRSGLDYFDLFLIHDPIAKQQVDHTMFPSDESGQIIVDDNIDYLESWKGLEDLVEAGLVRSIGVSNFNISQVDRILENCKIKPANNQIECHPYLNCSDLVKHHKQHGISVTAFRPLVRPDRKNLLTGYGVPLLLENETLNKIGKQYGKSAAQVAIRYQVERGVIVVPKSSNEANLRANINIFDFKLSEDDMKEIDNLDVNGRTFFAEPSKHSKFYPF